MRTSPQPRLLRWTLSPWVAAGALLLVSSAACVGEDECAPGESRCDGDGIVTCGSPGDVSGKRSWSGLAAGCGQDRCLDVVDGALRIAVCSTSGQKDARCPVETRGLVCLDDRTRVTCQLGYASAEKTCTACVTLPSSPTNPGAVVCAAEATPNAACDGFVGRACDGAAVVECQRGWVTTRTACGADAPTCVVASGTFNQGSPFCVRSETCAEPDAVRCEGSGVRGCVAGRVVASGCATDEACRSYADASRCERRCRSVRDGVCLDPG